MWEGCLTEQFAETNKMDDPSFVISGEFSSRTNLVPNMELTFQAVASAMGPKWRGGQGMCVETNIAPAVNTFVVAQAINAEKVAFDEFPSRVNARKGLAEINHLNHGTTSGRVTDVVVGHDK